MCGPQQSARALLSKLGGNSCDRTFATHLKGTGEDIKTVQELMRRANSRLTLEVCAQALTPAKRAAHLKLVEMTQPVAETAVVPTHDGPASVSD